MRRLSMWFGLAVLCAGCGTKMSQTNGAEPNAVAGELPRKFTAADGSTIDLDSYKGKKNIVLVVLRGYTGYICPYCSAQTSSLIANKAEFEKRDTVVLLLFPGPKDQLDQLRKKVRLEKDAAFPYPILLDENFKAVESLGIRGDHAKPSTYLLDKKGDIRYSYIGKSKSDRPSVKVLLDQLSAWPK